jgi:hypothetical protein
MADHAVVSRESEELAAKRREFAWVRLEAS